MHNEMSAPRVGLLLPLFGACLAMEMDTTVLHGSGTTNPSKIIWRMMETLEERTYKPVKLTYRAVGSGTGQDEFIGPAGLPDSTSTDYTPCKLCSKLALACFGFSVAFACVAAWYVSGMCDVKC